MEITYLIVLIAVIRGIASALRNRKPVVTALMSGARESLCVTCAYAHIAHGFRKRRKFIACNFGGSVRPLKFDVSACTLYCARNAGPQLVRVVGFAGSMQHSLKPSVAASASTDN